MNNATNKIYRIMIMLMGFMVIAFGTVNAVQYCSTQTGAQFKILDVVWGNSTHLISAGPGQRDVPLTVTAESFGNQCTLYNLEGYLTLAPGLSNFNGTAYSTYYAQSIGPNQIFNMVFNLNIASNETAAPNKTVTDSLYILWNYTNETTRNSAYYPLTIPIEGSPQLSFNVKNRALVAGEQNNITMQISNSGSGYAYDIVTAISPSSSVSLENQPSIISTLAPGGSQNVSLYLYISPDLAGQAVPLNLASHYISPYGYNISASSVLGLYALPISQSALTVSASSQDLLSGSVDKEYIVISNYGTQPISNLSVQLTPQSPMSLIGSDGYSEFSEVAPGANVVIPTELYVSSSSSTVASLDISLTYALNGQSETSSRSISFLLPGFVNITTQSTTYIPSIPQRGSILSITSTLENLGTSTASAATVTAYPPQGFTIIGSNSTFIGSISTATPTAFTFSFAISPTIKAGTYSIPVKLTYSNNLNQRQNQTFSFPVTLGASNSTSGNYVVIGGAGGYGRYNSSSGKGATQGSGTFILIIVVIVICAVAYYLYRRNKNKSKHKDEKKVQK